MKILVAIDGSKFSEATTQAVLKHTQTKDTEVALLHVVEPLPAVVGDETRVYIPDMEAMRQAQLKQAEALVAWAANLLRPAGFKVSTLVEEGDPVTKIIDRAAAWKADLIVLGSHGLKGFERLLLGSVSEGVARHAPCTVEIVRMPPERVAKAA